jgi:hypothetical protein
MRLGWSAVAISVRLGMDSKNLLDATCRPTDRIQVATAKRIAAVYDEMSMSLPPTSTRGQRISVARTQGLAQRRGWPPPLAWDNPDDPHEQPVTHAAVTERTDVDPIVIERIIGGDASLARSATWAERESIVRRWRADGRPLNELERLTGWQPRKYLREDAA